VTHADLKAMSKEDPTKNEAQLSVARMQNAASPMPPASLHNPPTASDISTLQNWINAGYPTGSCTVDGGTPIDSGSTGAVDVFSGEPPFAPGTGPDTHNAGRDCMQCHSGGGNAPGFMFGGTLYDGKGNPVSGAEIRVVDKSGKGYSVYTGPSGTFYRGGGTLATPGHTGARDATSKAVMVSSLTGGGCSSCHCTGSNCVTMPMHLP
jgi:hypothetical protein